MQEQFIQDTICHPRRLERVMAAIGKPWKFHDNPGNGNRDVVCQEFSFVGQANAKPCGRRIDVLATFEGRTKVLICEVKLLAGDNEVEQLNTYVDQFPTSPQFGQLFSSGPEVAGILLSAEFALAGQNKLNAASNLVQFKFDGLNFPFNPNPKTMTVTASNDRPYTPDVSGLDTLESHRKYLGKNLKSDLERESLRTAFDRITNLFLTEDQAEPDRLEWLVCNPKGEHIAIHYKGVYVVWMWAFTKFLRFGYSGMQTKNLIDISSNNDPQLAKAKLLLHAHLQQTDDETDFIPTNFAWNDSAETARVRLEA